MRKTQLILMACLGCLAAGPRPLFAQLTWQGCPDLQDADFTKTTVLANEQDAGLVEPLRLDIDKSGRIFVALKRSGTILMLDPADKYKKTKLGQVPVTPLYFHGLLGMVLAPDFLTSGFIYVLTTHRDQATAPILFRLSRITLSGTALDPASQKTILEWPTNTEEGHTGGGMAFGPDGTLLITTGGDTWARPSAIPHPTHTYKMTGSNDYRTPIDELDPAFNGLRSSANTNDLRGKLLRIKPIAVPASHPQSAWGVNVTYTIPDGNLFPAGKAKTRPEIFAMGFRNPYTLTVADNGTVYLADVGPQGTVDVLTGPPGGDQLYIIPKPGNYGWPMFVNGNEPYPIFDYATESVKGQFDPKLPINFSVYNTGLDTLPPTLAPAAVNHEKASLNVPGWFTAGAMAGMSGPIYHYNGTSASKDRFPPHFDGKWIIADEQQNVLKAVTLKGDQVTDVRNIFSSFKFYNPLSMKFAPDGSLYVIEYSGWNSSNIYTKISRIAYAGKCLPATTAIESPAIRPGIQGETLWYQGGDLIVPPQAVGVELFSLQGKRLYARTFAPGLDRIRLPIAAAAIKSPAMVKFAYPSRRNDAR